VGHFSTPAWVIFACRLTLQIINTVRTPHHFDQLFRIISTVAQCIQANVWYPNPGMFCSGCEYADECAAW